VYEVDMDDNYFYPEEDEPVSNYDLYDVEEEWMGIMLPFLIIAAIINAILSLFPGEDT
jgi:hypothetical protein